MSKHSETNWARVDALDDASIDTSDIPPLSDSFFSRAKLRPAPPPVHVTLDMDPEVLAWFQSQGVEWEQRINAALRLYAETHRMYRPPPAA